VLTWLLGILAPQCLQTSQDKQQGLCAEYAFCDHLKRLFAVMSFFDESEAQYLPGFLAHIRDRAALLVVTSLCGIYAKR
jgi:hypothetical protein